MTVTDARNRHPPQKKASSGVSKTSVGERLLHWLVTPVYMPPFDEVKDSSGAPVVPEENLRRRWGSLLRFALTNIVLILFFLTLFMEGYVLPVFEQDQTYLTHFIFGVFCFGWLLSCYRVWFFNREYNHTHETDCRAYPQSYAARFLEETHGCSPGSRTITIGRWKLILSRSLQTVRFIAGILMLFGLIGTVVGFIIALSGVDAEKAGDVSAVFPMISTLIAGMSVALYTTLVGSIAGGVWLRLNYHFLSQSAVELLTTLILLSQDQAKALASEDAKGKEHLVALLERLDTKLTR